MELNKNYIIQTLEEERLWKVGEADSFSFGAWELTLRKEESAYEPFMYSLNGINVNGYGSWSRRYKTMESAFLHILNHFNENANIKNNYNTLEEALIKCNKI